MLLYGTPICIWSSIVIIAADESWSTLAVPCVEGPCQVVPTSVSIQPLHHRRHIASCTVILPKLCRNHRVLIGHWFDVLVPAVLIVAMVEVVAVPHRSNVVEGVVWCVFHPLC